MTDEYGEKELDLVPKERDFVTKAAEKALLLSCLSQLCLVFCVGFLKRFLVKYP